MVRGTNINAFPNEDFRKLVEDSVPGSSDVLGAILGDPDGPQYTGLGVPPSKMKNLPITTGGATITQLYLLLHRAVSLIHVSNIF